MCGALLAAARSVGRAAGAWREIRATAQHRSRRCRRGRRLHARLAGARPARPQVHKLILLACAIVDRFCQNLIIVRLYE